MVEKLLSREIEPASFGILDGYATLGSAGDEMERRACASATKSQSAMSTAARAETRCRAYRVGMSEKE